MTADSCHVPSSGCFMPETRIMKEARRPTLCVIDENGFEITPKEDLESRYCPDTFENGIISLNTCLSNLNCKLNEKEVQTNNDQFSRVAKDLESTEIKTTNAMLNLAVCRQSPRTLTWKQKYLQLKSSPVQPVFDVKKLCDSKDNGFTVERSNRINEALAWLKRELETMRKEDEILERRLLSIRRAIHQLKLQKSCREHQDMLDDVTQDMEETHELHGVSDFPLIDSVHDTRLRHLGVTKMHLSSRRFSTC